MSDNAVIKGGRHLVALLFCVGLFQVAGYYLSGALVRSDGGMSIPQPDTMLYCQAARRIVEGHPFSFSPGTLPSTGTTSHAYPFVLALPYALGCTGDALFRASFALNALFYLVFIMGWGTVIDRKCVGRSSRVTAGLTVALFGQAAFSAFSQTDIGFWMAVSAILAAGYALRCPWLYGSMLILGPWVRPEGMFCVLAFVVAMGVARSRCIRIGEAQVRGYDCVIAMIAVVSSAGVFVLNYYLTGQAGFSSLAHKGHFASKTFAQAVYATVVDGMSLVKPFFFGLSDCAPRSLCVLPVLGAVFLWTAVFGRAWRRDGDWLELAWLLAVGVGFLSVAQSGMQDMNVDRYLAWSLPTILVFVAAGAGMISRIIESRLHGGWGALPCVLTVAFGAVMSVVHVFMLHMTSCESDVKRDFASRCHKIIPSGASVGSWNGGGIYEMPGRRLAQLSGVYSPEFRTRYVSTGVFEILKNEPATRFDYLLATESVDQHGLGFGGAFSDAVQVFVGPKSCQLLKMNWSSFSAAAVTPLPPEPGMLQVGRVDVGYDPDETAAGYCVVPSYDIPPFDPVVFCCSNKGVRMVDVGRVVVGGDRMAVNLTPGKDLHVVMRTCPQQKVMQKSVDGGGWVDYAFANPLQMAVFVDGEPAGTASLKYSDDGFTDVSFRIPAASIRSARPELSFFGDHIACCYWFFQ